MNSQNQSQVGEEQEPKQLGELMKIVMLTPTQMLSLTSDDEKFTEKIVQYNQMGVLHINNEDYSEALVYLQEAEKLLQYAASCGKTIDRILITSTLQNEACAYQRLWELEKSSNYMEAIIYNMNAYLDNGPHLDINPSNSYSDPQFYEMVGLFVNKRLSIAFYYLQFSAVSSQTKKHQIALKNAYKALDTLQLICDHCSNYEQFLKRESSTHEPTNTIFKTLTNLEKDIDPELYPRYLKQAKRSIAKLRHKISQKTQSLDQSIQTLREFTIGEVMQISPTTVEDMTHKSCLKEEVAYSNKIYKAFYISICYFAIATELRLLSSEKYITESERKNCLEFKKSQIYHLNSIHIAALFSPCESMYLDHIMKSFKNHYDMDLSEASSYIQVSSIEVESQNYIEMDRAKHKMQDSCDFENAQLKDQVKTQRQNGTKITTYTSQKCLENVHIHVKKKKKKHIIVAKKTDFKNEKTKSNLRPDKISLNPLSLKSIDTPNMKTRRKSSFTQQKTSKDHIMHHPIPSRSQNKSKRLQHSEEKSKSKSKSKSTKKNLKISGGHPNKSKEKIKKKNARLHEEYFLKNDKKKQKRKSINSQSMSKNKVSDYGGEEIKGTIHTISISKISHKKSKSKLGKHKP